MIPAPREDRPNLFAVWGTVPQLPEQDSKEFILSIFKNSLKRLRVAWVMSLCTILSISALSALLFCFASIFSGLKTASEKLPEDVTVLAVIKEGETFKSESSLKSLNFIKSFEVLSSEEGLNRFSRAVAIPADTLETLKSDNPIPETVRITVGSDVELTELKEALGNINEIDEILVDETLFSFARKVMRSVRTSGTILSLVLVFIVSFLISMSIIVSLFLNRDEIEVAKLCGAADRDVLLPPVVDSLILLIIGLWLGAIFSGVFLRALSGGFLAEAGISVSLVSPILFGALLCALVLAVSTGTTFAFLRSHRGSD